MTNKNFLTISSALVLTAVISFSFYFPKRMENLLSHKIYDFPKEIGEWISEDVILSEREYELLETRNLIVRNYKNTNNDIINLYIIYSPRNRKVVHPPEICLQGAGSTITNKEHIQITDSISSTKLIIEKGITRDLIVYWYRAGKFNTDNYLKQQIKIVLDRVIGRETSVALIRVSTEIENNEVEPALEKIKGFCTAIEPLLDKYIL